MAWGKTDVEEFSRLLRAYWPTLKESEEELQALLTLYVKHLLAFRPTVVFDAMGALKTAGKRFLPDINEILEECRKNADPTDRQRLLARLLRMAEERDRVPYYLTAKGKYMEIARFGLVERRHPDGVRSGVILAWADVPGNCMAEILRENERHVIWEPIVSFKECKRSPAKKYRICLMEPVFRR